MQADTVKNGKMPILGVKNVKNSRKTELKTKKWK